jgi:hypothetical protein
MDGRMISPIAEVLRRVLRLGSRRSDGQSASAEGDGRSREAPRRPSARWVRQSYRMYRGLWGIL